MPVESEVVAGQSIAGYVVEALIGRGGMGEVYRAHDEQLDRPVALKLLLRELAGDESFRARMLRESRLAASLDHPNVVPIYEAGESGERLFIAMRYVDGIDLKGLLRRDGALDPERALALASQVAAALDAAHSKGLVHRDVKPSNVLIDDPDGRAHCYLADFGLTQTANREDRANGPELGTIDYVSPEQIRGDPLDGRSDQYALGCLLFETLTGTLPYGRGSDVAALFAHLEEPAPAASERRPGLPREVDAVLARALAKDPGQRYESCAGLVEDARGALGIEQVAARRRRRLLGVAVAGLVAAGTAIALIVTLAARPADPVEPVGSLVAIDTGSGRLDARYTVAPVPTHVTTESGQVWFAADDALWRLDPEIGEPVKVETVGAIHDLAGYQGRVFAARDGKRLLEGIVTPYDARNGFRGDGVSILACSLTAAGDLGVWAAGCPDVQRLRVQPTGVTVARSTTIPFRQPTTSGSERQCLCAMTVGAGSVWVVGDASDRRVWRIAPSGGIVRTFELPVIPRGIAVANGSAWITAPLDDLVLQLDIESGRVVQRIAVGRNPMGIAYGDGALWVAESLEGSVARIDPETARVTARVGVGGHPYEAAVGMGAVWVTSRDA